MPNMLRILNTPFHDARFPFYIFIFLIFLFVCLFVVCSVVRFFFYFFQFFFVLFCYCHPLILAFVCCLSLSCFPLKYMLQFQFLFTSLLLFVFMCARQAHVVFFFSFLLLCTVYFFFFFFLLMCEIQRENRTPSEA